MLTLHATLDWAQAFHHSDNLTWAGAHYRQNYQKVGWPVLRAQLGRRHYQPKLLGGSCPILLPPIHQLVFEKSVTTPESIYNKQFAGFRLDLDDLCLAFFHTWLALPAASRVAVRRSIFPRSVGCWKLFQAHLKPLRLALGVPGSSPNPNRTPPT